MVLPTNNVEAQYTFHASQSGTASYHHNRIRAPVATHFQHTTVTSNHALYTERYMEKATGA